MAKEEGGGSGMPGTLGLLIVAGGVVLVFLVLRSLGGFDNPSGTPGQTNILGALLGLPYASGQAPAPVKGPSTVQPGTGSSCPKGYAFYNGQCIKVIPIPD